MLSDNLKRIRGFKGYWSARELENVSGVCAATIRNIESGKTSDIKSGTVEKLARALEVEPALLYARQLTLASA